MPSPHPCADFPRTNRTNKQHRISLIFAFNLSSKTVFPLLTDESVRLQRVLRTGLVVPFVCAVQRLERLCYVVLHELVDQRGTLLSVWMAAKGEGLLRPGSRGEGEVASGKGGWLLCVCCGESSWDV